MLEKSKEQKALKAAAAVSSREFMVIALIRTVAFAATLAFSICMHFSILFVRLSILMNDPYPSLALPWDAHFVMLEYSRKGSDWLIHGKVKDKPAFLTDNEIESCSSGSC